MLIKIRHHGLPFITTKDSFLVYYGLIHCYVILT